MPTRISAETIARLTASWELLLQDVADGKPIQAAIRARGFSPDMVRAYKRDVANAREQWDDARQQSADAFADEILATIDNSGMDPQHARVRVDALKWLAAKRNPRVYSERVDHNLTVRTVDLTKVIADARERVRARRERTLPGTCERVIEPDISTLLGVSVPEALADLV